MLKAIQYIYMDLWTASWVTLATSESDSQMQTGMMKSQTNATRERWSQWRTFLAMPFRTPRKNLEKERLWGMLGW